MEGVTIIKAATLLDHVHMYVSIPPKNSVAKAVGRIKGKIKNIPRKSFIIIILLLVCIFVSFDRTEFSAPDMQPYGKK